LNLTVRFKMVELNFLLWDGWT